MKQAGRLHCFMFMETTHHNEVVGIDFGSKLAGTTAIVFWQNGELHWKQSEKRKDADEFLHHHLQWIQPSHVFIDAPLSLPFVYKNPEVENPNFFYRDADLVAKAMSPMFLGGLTARAMKLVHSFPEFDFYEAYPKLAAAQLDLNQFGYKRKEGSLARCQEKVLQAMELKSNASIQDWHQLDALLAFWVGMKHGKGKAQHYGAKAEGLIWF